MIDPDEYLVRDLALGVRIASLERQIQAETGDVGGLSDELADRKAEREALRSEVILKANEDLYHTIHCWHEAEDGDEVCCICNYYRSELDLDGGAAA